MIQEAGVAADSSTGVMTGGAATTIPPGNAGTATPGRSSEVPAHAVDEVTAIVGGKMMIETEGVATVIETMGETCRGVTTAARLVVERVTGIVEPEKTAGMPDAMVTGIAIAAVTSGMLGIAAIAEMIARVVRILAVWLFATQVGYPAAVAIIAAMSAAASEAASGVLSEIIANAIPSSGRRVLHRARSRREEGTTPLKKEAHRQI